MTNQSSALRRIELGTLITLALAVIGFAFWLGGLQAQVNILDPKHIAASVDAKVTDALARSGVVPSGTIIAWYAKSGPIPVGWARCDGNDNRPDLTGRFLRGTTRFGDVSASGGSETHKHVVWKDSASGDGRGFAKDGNCGLGFTDTANHLPPYYTVMYLIKL